MIKRIKYGCFALLFIVTLTLSSIVAILASSSGGLDNSFYLTYEPPRAEVYFINNGTATGQMYSLLGISLDISERETDTTISSITFDFYNDENLAIVENAVECFSVANDGSDDILCYKVANGEMFDVYVLSNYIILLPENIGHLFSNLGAVTQITLNNFNTRNVKYMFMLFSLCENLTTIYVGRYWSLESVEYMDDIVFNFCNNLVGGNGTSFATAGVTDATYARVDTAETPGYFTLIENADGSSNTNRVLLQSGAELAKKIKNTDTYPEVNDTITSIVFGDNSEENLSKVENATRSVSVAVDGSDDAILYEVGTEIYILSSKPMIANINCSYLFYECSSLTSIDLTGLNTENATNMYSMFSGCSSLTSLDLTQLNTSNVTDMSFMFSRCSSLTSLDLTSLDTSNVASMPYMFSNCSKLATIYANDSWSTANVTSSLKMFSNCTVLVGGNGTTCDGTNNIDATYARIDTAETPGYFTRKTA